jgi:PAS domain S-box-containing protein
LVFRRFIGVFARPEHPLALFLDDLQWLDAATLDVIADLLTQRDVRSLLLIGAYRDNEVGPDHPLTSGLEEIRKSGAPTPEIKLAPLTLEHLTRLITDSLRCEPERAIPLAQLVHGKTAGNPFFAIQFLSAIVEEGLITFDHVMRRWSWDLSRIQAKGYADNVANLIAAKLTRLPLKTQKALQQLACLGNVAAPPALSVVLEVSEEEAHAVLSEAVSQEFIRQIDNAYRFVHDRVQEAAYALIPEASRAETHLRIGRRLLAHTPREKQEEAIFEIVSQLNRGVTLIPSRGERETLAALNLIAGRRAKASAAYVSALVYLSVGSALLEKDRWERRHDLAFALELNQAECEFLTGDLASAQERLTALSKRAADTLERASVAGMRIDLYMTLDQSGRAVAAGLEYLRQVGGKWRPHPSEEEALREYRRIWSALGDRTVEELIDLPLMNNPASLATLDVLIRLRPPALFTDSNLTAQIICKAINLCLDQGNSDGSCVAYVWLGMIAGPRFGDYKAGYRFGKLGYELVERRGLKRFQARTYVDFAVFGTPWAKHIRTGRDLLRRAFQAANRIGDLPFAGFSCNNLITNLLMSGDPLPDVEREAESSLHFVQRARFGLVADIITSQLRLIRSLRGLTRSAGSFDDEQFDERKFERHLSSKADLAVAECFHWIRRLQACVIFGDQAGALNALEKAQPLLWTSKSFPEAADYHLYGALACASSCDSAEPALRQQRLEPLAAHQQQLETWAEHCPENFESRAALASAEIARIEGRPLDAELLYERAIQSARANGFPHIEALANELAGRFYFGRGLEATGLAHLREARTCYALWGADGKVKQLDQAHPELTPQRTRLAASAPHLDVATVAQATGAMSGEIELPKLIETLMTIALENAGADRGLLILPRGAGFEVEVEAIVGGKGVEVGLTRSAIAKAECPEVVINYVIRTHKSVILDDASHPGPIFQDDYFRHGAARSVFCLPLLRQARLAGALYLENTRAAYAFTADRIAVLEVLAAQAAISIENARLYGDLRESEAKYKRIVNTASEGIWALGPQETTSFVNARMAEMLGFRPEEMLGRPLTDFLMEEDAADHLRKMEHRRQGKSEHYERRFRHSDGHPVWTQVSAAPMFDEQHGFQGSFAMLTDITERKRSEVKIMQLNRKLEKHVAELEEAHGQLASFSYSLSHDLRTPLLAVEGFSHLLQSEYDQALNAEGRRYVRLIRQGAARMNRLIDGIQAFLRISRGEMTLETVDMTTLAGECREELGASAPERNICFILDDLPPAYGDRVLIRQVLTHLLGNAIKFTAQKPLAVIELSGTATETENIYRVKDNGAGFDMRYGNRLFEPFQRLHSADKFEGIGVGLAVVRRIIRRHGGRIWAESKEGEGAAFFFALPRQGDGFERNASVSDGLTTQDG